MGVELTLDSWEPESCLPRVPFLWFQPKHF
jgi:hypothetical protein